MSESDRRLLYLVRHGITAWNRIPRMQGHTDITLDAEGQEQARRLAARLASTECPPQVVWSSDLARARQTAEAIAAARGLAVQTTPLLRETMLGDWEGLTREEIEARGEADLLARYRQDPHRHRPPGGETSEAAWERMHRALDLICSQHPTEHIAIVGHGGSLRALLCAALEAPLPSMYRFILANASLSIIEESCAPDRRVRRVLLINDTSHLT